jgi:hypothetical protein
MRRSLPAIAALALLATATTTPTLAATAPTRTQRVSADGELLGRGYEARGTATFHVPTAWTSANRTPRPRTAILAAQPAAGCQVDVRVSVRGTATSMTTGRQVARSLRDQATAGGSRAHGTWGMGPSGAILYGIGAVHVQARKYLQIRVFATPGAGCDPSVLTAGEVPAAVQRIVSRGTVAARVVRRR